MVSTTHNRDRILQVLIWPASQDLALAVLHDEFLCASVWYSLSMYANIGMFLNWFSVLVLNVVAYVLLPIQFKRNY